MKKTFLSIGIILFNVILEAQVWLPVGVGPTGRIGALAVYNSELYAGGYFLNSDGTRDLLKWNGTNWSTANRTFNVPNYNYSNNIYALAEYNSELYAGGHNADGQPFNLAAISRFNGSTWLPVEHGVGDTAIGPHSVNALAVYNNELFAGGSFFTANNTLVNNIAKWNGTTWSPVGSGITGSGISAMTIYNGELYIGGNFSIAGGNAANNIAKWNGTSWLPVGTGVNGAVYSLAVYNGELYIGGNFSIAGGNPANKIAKWNGTSWSTVGNGMDNTILALTVFNNELYAGGSFIIAGGVYANRIAKWNGSIWSSLGTGMNNSVWSLITYNSELYAGGLFSTADNNIANYIAKLNNNVIGILEYEQKQKLNIYPNPFSAFTTIKFNSLINNGTVHIYSIYGQEIKNYKNISGNELKIYKDNLINGIYFINVTVENKIIATDKLIIND